MSNTSTQHTEGLHRDTASGSKANVASDLTPAAKKKFVLAAIRAAHIRVQLLTLEITEIEVGLTHGMITAEFAVTWLDYIGALDFVNVAPFTNKFEVTE